MADAKSRTLYIGSTDMKARALIGHQDHVDKHEEGVVWVERQCEWPQRRVSNTVNRYGQCPLEQAATRRCWLAGTACWVLTQPGVQSHTDE